MHNKCKCTYEYKKIYMHLLMQISSEIQIRKLNTLEPICLKIVAHLTFLLSIWGMPVKFSRFINQSSLKNHLISSLFHVDYFIIFFKDSKLTCILWILYYFSQMFHFKVSLEIRNISISILLRKIRLVSNFSSKITVTD